MRKEIISNADVYKTMDFIVRFMGGYTEKLHWKTFEQRGKELQSGLRLEIIKFIRLFFYLPCVTTIVNKNNPTLICRLFCSCSAKIYTVHKK